MASPSFCTRNFLTWNWKALTQEMSLVVSKLRKPGMEFSSEIWNSPEKYLQSVWEYGDVFSLISDLIYTNHSSNRRAWTVRNSAGVWRRLRCSCAYYETMQEVIRLGWTLGKITSQCITRTTECPGSVVFGTELEIYKIRGKKSTFVRIFVSPIFTSYPVYVKWLCNSSVDCCGWCP